MTLPNFLIIGAAKSGTTSAVLRRRVTEQYRGDIIATGELIGRDLSHWLAQL